MVRHHLLEGVTERSAVSDAEEHGRDCLVRMRRVEDRAEDRGLRSVEAERGLPFCWTSSLPRHWGVEVRLLAKRNGKLTIELVRSRAGQSAGLEIL